MLNIDYDGSSVINQKNREVDYIQCGNERDSLNDDYTKYSHSVKHVTNFKINQSSDSES